MKIRFKKILELIIFGRGEKIFTIFWIVFIIYATIHDSANSLFLDQYLNPILTVLIFISFFYISYNQLKFWLKAKSNLLVLENFFFLIILGIYISAFLGSIDYLLYKSNNNNFLIEKSYEDSFNEKVYNDLSVQLQETKLKVLTLLKINNSLSPYDSLIPDNKETLKWNTRDPNIYLKYAYVPPSIGTVEFHELIVVYENYRISLFNHLQNSKIRIFHNYNKSYSASVLKEIIEMKLLEEEKFLKHIESKLDTKVYEIRFIDFLYAKIISSLNYDTGLYKANSLLTKVLEFVFALFRFIYFGFVVALLIDSWEKSTANNL